MLQADRIVEDIAMQMSKGQWIPHRSVRELALSLNMSIQSAERYAAMAARVLRLSWGREDAQVAVLEGIASIARDAKERTEEVIDSEGNVRALRKPDFKAALAALNSLKETLGMAAQRAEVVVRYQQMTDAELLSEVSRLALKEKEQGNGAIEIDGIEIGGAHADALDRIDTEATRGGWGSRV